MKQMILYVIAIDVFIAPFGLAGSREVGPVLLAIVVFIAKAIGLGIVFAVIDNTFSKLRLFKLTEFMAGAFLVAVLSVLVLAAGVAG